MSGERYLVLAAMTGVLLAGVALYTFGFDGGFFGLPARVVYVAAPAIAFVSGVYAVLAYGTDNRYGRALGWVTAGFAAWLAAEILFIVLEVSGLSPFPSVADVLFLLGYPLVLIGLYDLMKLGEIEWTLERKVMAGIIGILLSVLVAYFGIYKVYDPELPLLDNALGMGYGVADLVLILAALIVAVTALDMKEGALYTCWMIFTIGLAITLGADIFYAIFSPQYADGNYFARQVDLAYMASYLIMGWAFYATGYVINKANADMEEKLRSRAGAAAGSAPARGNGRGKGKGRR